jgi:hypothetical protein
MSKRVMVTLASAAVLSAVVPGIAGYVTAQFEALDQARKDLARLQSQLRMVELNVEPAAAVPCGPGTSSDDNMRELQVPRHTHVRPWHNSAYMQAMPPSIWSSLEVPNIARPAVSPWPRELAHQPFRFERSVRAPRDWPHDHSGWDDRNWRER